MNPSSDADFARSLNQLVSPYVYAPLAALCCVLILLILKRFFLSRLERWAEKTKTVWDDILINAVSFPATLLIIISGLVIFMILLPLPDQADRLMLVILKAFVILTVVLFLDGFAMGAMKRKAGSAIFARASQGFTRGLVRGLIAGLGVLTFFNLIGISITPILASLGIGSLAVALALQDTLSNFFAGLYVAVDKPVRVGDFIKLESGEEGYVTDMGWRSARIRLLSDNTVIIPNAKLSGSVITNYYLPSKEVAFGVPVTVSYGSDLSKVETITCEVAREVMKKVPGGVAAFEPAVRFHTFGESGIQLNVALRAREFTDTFLIKHELIKALHTRYQEEGITIPFPARMIDLSEKTVTALVRGKNTSG